MLYFIIRMEVNCNRLSFFGKGPAAITDSTSNSAKIVCSYANVPTTAEYGVKERW